jgi:Protein of unknown function (DUF559)
MTRRVLPPPPERGRSVAKAGATAQARRPVGVNHVRLAARGVAVLRFWNSDVIENMSGVLEKISLVAAELSQDAVTPTQRWRVATKE